LRIQSMPEQSIWACSAVGWTYHTLRQNIVWLSRTPACLRILW
jgi:hypothetical protein